MVFFYQPHTYLAINYIFSLFVENSDKNLKLGNLSLEITYSVIVNIGKKLREDTWQYIQIFFKIVVIFRLCIKQ